MQCPVCGAATNASDSQVSRCPLCGHVWRRAAPPESDRDIARGDASAALRAGSFAPLRQGEPGVRMMLRLPNGGRTALAPGDSALFTRKSLGIALERHGWRIERRNGWSWRQIMVTARKL